MHCHPPKRRLYPNPTSTWRPGPAPLTALPVPSAGQAEQGILDKATFTPQYSLDFWPTSFFPAWLPLGTGISKLHISSSPAIKCQLRPRQGAQWEMGQAPALLQRGWAAGRHKGRKAASSPEQVARSLPKEAAGGGSGFTPPGLQKVTWQHYHVPLKEANKLLLRSTGQGRQGRQGGRAVQGRAERLLRGKRCTLTCLERWSLRANFFSHTGHW